LDPCINVQTSVTNLISGDTLNNIRRETSRHFRNKKRENMKDKIYEIVTNSKNKNKNKNKNIRDLYRGINIFERGYQPRSYLVKRPSHSSGC
jgi:hypothetical protein